MDALDRMFCDTLQHLAQIILGIECVQLRRLGQRINCSGTLAPVSDATS
jgi:hypothetical protein